MIWKGLRFGMLLQFAVGPVCFFVFNTATTHGFAGGLHVVAAAALIDALYISLSCVGVAAILNRKAVTAWVKLAGCLVLILFGLNTILGVFHVSLLPNVALFSHTTSENLFVQGVLFTASNPLTIVFWSGMFSTQIIEYRWDKTQLFLFAVGCVMATVIFLTAVAWFGSILSGFLPQIAVQILNITVGILLIVFGIKLLRKKENAKPAAQ
ncbi:MAG: LysE family translocator [Lawsonibacter sp.]